MTPDQAVAEVQRMIDTATNEEFDQFLNSQRLQDLWDVICIKYNWK